jgi:adenine-specific DNA-methyltransferase
MKLKEALIACLMPERLKKVCDEFSVDANRRSSDAMATALAGAKGVKAELLIKKLGIVELRTALDLLGQPTDGDKPALIERLLATGSRSATAEGTKVRVADDGNVAAYLRHSPQARTRTVKTGDDTAQYRHNDEAVQRPDAGVQDQFQARKPARTYRYDSSLDPALSWDEQRERNLGEWLLGLIVRATKEGEQAVFGDGLEWKGGGVRVASTADAASLLQDISKPYLNWAGKAERHEIHVPSTPLFVHERHSTKAILDGIRHRKARGQTLDLFGDSQLDIRENLEAYEHKGPWQNRMILGDSLAVMNSLLEFEGLGGQVQMIYIDPPYGVKFGSNFQPFVRKRDVKHGGDEDMTREPEMVKAYRDTWDLGLHSFLTYLRDRIVVARDLLADSGSIFVQISDDNLHHVRELLDEVFGPENFVAIITYAKTTSTTSEGLSVVNDYIIWFVRDRSKARTRLLYKTKRPGEVGGTGYTKVRLKDGSMRALADFSDELPEGAQVYATGDMTSSKPPGDFPVKFAGKTWRPAKGYWKTGEEGMQRLINAGRVMAGTSTLSYVRYLNDFPCFEINNIWTDTVGQNQFGPSGKIYAVQTANIAVERCLLMSTSPGDLVLDPTCGSGTTACVAEQWGRRWITIDTSRVPLALARQRQLTATFPYYELKSPPSGPQGGFVYTRKQNHKGDEIGGLVPHITLKSIAKDEPPAMEVLVDRPEEVSGVTRVSGPFVVEATIAPVQTLETAGDNGTVDGDVTMHIQRMTEVLRQSKTLRLPGNRELMLAGVRRTVDTEYLHAEAKDGDRRVAIVFGPQDGAVSATLVYEAGREAHYLKYDRLYFFGFAVEPNARAMIDDERKLRIPATYVAVTPDVAMSDLLKTTRASEIFSVTGLPDFDIRKSKKKGPEGQLLYEVELNGLDEFDPESMETDHRDAEDVPCWMLDSDYDGLSFYATQVFFPKTSAWDNLQRSLKATFDESVWTHLAGTVSEPFALGDRRRVAVKVIDERGNELLRLRDVKE